MIAVYGFAQDHASLQQWASPGHRRGTELEWQGSTKSKLKAGSQEGPEVCSTCSSAPLLRPSVSYAAQLLPLSIRSQSYAVHRCLRF